MISPGVKLSLHRSATQIYVQPWLSPSQLQARHNLQPTIQQLQERVQDVETGEQGGRVVGACMWGTAKCAGMACHGCE